MFLQEQLNNLRKLIDNVTAKKALADSEGNVISETYLKKKDVEFLTPVEWNADERTLYLK